MARGTSRKRASTETSISPMKTRRTRASVAAATPKKPSVPKARSTKATPKTATKAKASTKTSPKATPKVSAKKPATRTRRTRASKAARTPSASPERFARESPSPSKSPPPRIRVTVKAPVLSESKPASLCSTVMGIFKFLAWISTFFTIIAGFAFVFWAAYFPLEGFNDLSRAQHARVNDLVKAYGTARTYSYAGVLANYAKFAAKESKSIEEVETASQCKAIVASNIETRFALLYYTRGRGSPTIQRWNVIADSVMSPFRVDYDSIATNYQGSPMEVCSQVNAHPIEVNWINTLVAKGFPIDEVAVPFDTVLSWLEIIGAPVQRALASFL